MIYWLKWMPHLVDRHVNAASRSYNKLLFNQCNNKITRQVLVYKYGVWRGLNDVDTCNLDDKRPDGVKSMEKLRTRTSS